MTHRERLRKKATVALFADGFTGPDIADAMGLSLRTVRRHLAEVRRRAGAIRADGERFRADMEAES